MTQFLILSIFLQFTAKLPVPQSLQHYEYEEPHMGTIFRFQLYAPNKTAADRAARAGFARVKQLNQILSDYQSNSELMQLCQKA